LDIGGAVEYMAGCGLRLVACGLPK